MPKLLKLDHSDFADRPIKILGSGGLSREITSALIRNGFSLSQIESVDLNKEADLPFNTLVILGMGSPEARSFCYKTNETRFVFPVFINAGADFGLNSEVGEGTTVASGCVITTDVHIDKGCYINIQVTIGHDSQIGEFSLINPGATISGGVKIGARVLIGANATVLDNIEIGEGATIGAGAVVTRNVAAGVTVVGVPARPIFRDTTKHI